MLNRAATLAKIGNHFRDARFVFFREFLDGFDGRPEPVRILDCGGTEEFWIARGFGDRSDVEVTVLNLTAQPTSTPHITSVEGDATDMSMYPDDSFDIAFSNSAIEHLYDFESQKKMAAEVRRVGVHHFVQTPNKWFFLEPHYLLPWFQFMPPKVVFWVLTRTRLSRGRTWDQDQARSYVNEIRLLSLREMQELFPESGVFHERFLGMRKSFVLHDLLR